MPGSTHSDPFPRHLMYPFRTSAEVALGVESGNSRGELVSELTAAEAIQRTGETAPEQCPKRPKSETDRSPYVCTIRARTGRPARGNSKAHRPSFPALVVAMVLNFPGSLPTLETHFAIRPRTRLWDLMRPRSALRSSRWVLSLLSYSGQPLRRSCRAGTGTSSNSFGMASDRRRLGVVSSAGEPRDCEPFAGFGAYNRSPLLIDREIRCPTRALVRERGCPPFCPIPKLADDTAVLAQSFVTEAPRP